MLGVDINERFEAVQGRIRQAEADAGRPMNSVGLIAVSKTQPADAIREAYALGQRDFGENYLQEALAKQEELVDLEDIVWHFIGPIQSNKTRPIAEHFDWVHTVDRIKTAERLDQQRPAHLPPLNLCIQVNVSGETTKSGVELSELVDLSDRMDQLHRVDLRGLMAIPAPINPSDEDPSRPLRRSPGLWVASQWECQMIWSGPFARAQRGSESERRSLVHAVPKLESPSQTSSHL